MANVIQPHRGTEVALLDRAAGRPYDVAASHWGATKGWDHTRNRHRISPLGLPCRPSCSKGPRYPAGRWLIPSIGSGGEAGRAGRLAVARAGGSHWTAQIESQLLCLDCDDCACHGAEHHVHDLSEARSLRYLMRRKPNPLKAIQVVDPISQGMQASDVTELES